MPMALLDDRPDAAEVARTSAPPRQRADPRHDRHAAPSQAVVRPRQAGDCAPQRRETRERGLRASPPRDPQRRIRREAASAPPRLHGGTGPSGCRVLGFRRRPWPPRQTTRRDATPRNGRPRARFARAPPRRRLADRGPWARPVVAAWRCPQYRGRRTRPATLRHRGSCAVSAFPKPSPPPSPPCVGPSGWRGATARRRPGQAPRRGGRRGVTPRRRARWPATERSVGGRRSQGRQACGSRPCRPRPGTSTMVLVRWDCPKARGGALISPPWLGRSRDARVARREAARRGAPSPSGTSACGPIPPAAPARARRSRRDAERAPALAPASPGGGSARPRRSDCQHEHQHAGLVVRPRVRGGGWRAALGGQQPAPPERLAPACRPRPRSIRASLRPQPRALDPRLPGSGRQSHQLPPTVTRPVTAGCGAHRRRLASPRQASLRGRLWSAPTKQPDRTPDWHPAPRTGWSRLLRRSPPL